MKSNLKRRSDEYTKQMYEVNSSRKEWGKFTELVKGIASEFESSEYLKNFFFIFKDNSSTFTFKPTDKGFQTKSENVYNLGAVQIGLGNYMLGIKNEEETKINEKTVSKSSDLEVETGARAIWTQLPNGSVALVYIPPKSKLHKEELIEDETSYIVSQIYNSPKDITRREIEKSVLFAIDYNIYCSALSRPDLTIHGNIFRIKKFVYRKRHINLLKKSIGAIGGLVKVIPKLLTGVGVQ